MLLLCDNFEHLVEEAPLVSEILDAAAGMKVLVTSRVRLNVSGETVFSVPGMGLGARILPAGSSQEDVTQNDKPQNDKPQNDKPQNEAMQLFLTTAARVRPGFELAEKDVGPLLEIVTLVQGSPLGLLLAAAWVDMLPLPEIAAEIAQSLDFLETVLADLPERRRSLRAVFDYSWRLLSSDERALYAALCVFRGGFTRQAAQRHFAESMRVCEELGATGAMLGLVCDVATALAAAGRAEEALEMAATAYAHPISLLYLYLSRRLLSALYLFSPDNIWRSIFPASVSSPPS